MPHLRIDYTGNLAARTDMDALCRCLAVTLVELDDGAGMTLFPYEGTRVLAYPAPHFAVADGSADKAFVYLNLRIASGRSAAQVAAAGEALLAAAHAHFAPLMAQRQLRVTLHIDVGAPVYEGKFATPTPG